MINASEIREHAEIIGSDGQHVGTVDRVEGSRIKLTKKDSSPAHAGHHHFIELDQVDKIDNGRVRLTVAGASAISSEEEQDGGRIQ